MRSPSSGGKRGKRRRNESAAGPEAYPALPTAPTTTSSTRSDRSSIGRGDASTHSASIDSSNDKSASTPADTLLINLADACKLHQRNHHSGRKASSGVGGAPDDFAADNVETPQKQCQMALETLGRVIIKVEDTYRAARQPTPQHLKHICDFYMHVCGGVFCPHAPTLFHRGRQGTHVMPRVHALMEHVITRPVISNLVAFHISSGPSSSTASSSDNSGAPQITAVSLHETLVQTITTLLVLIPESSVQVTVAHNLLRLLVDATTLVLVYSSSKMAEATETGGRIFTEPVRINVNLLAPTQSQNLLATAPGSVHASSTPSEAFRIDIQSLEQAWAWQAALLGITGGFMWRLHQIRAATLHQSSVVVPYNESSHISIEDLLAPSVINTLQRLVQSITTSPSFTADKRQCALQSHSRLRSLQLLETILNLRRSHALSSRCSRHQSLQVACLVVQATREYFCQQQSPSHEFGSNQVAALLATLLTRTVLLLPPMSTDEDCTETLTRMARVSVWPSLVDALSWTCDDQMTIRKGDNARDNSQKPLVPHLLQVDDHGQLLKAGDHEYTQLTNICLAILHQTVLENPALVSRLIVEEELSLMQSSYAEAVFTRAKDGHRKFISKVLNWVAHPVLGPQAVGLARIWLQSANMTIIGDGVKWLLEAAGGDRIGISDDNDASKMETDDGKCKKRKHGYPANLRKRQRVRIASVSSTQPGKLSDRKTIQQLENHFSRFLFDLARPAAGRLCTLTRETISSNSIWDVLTVSAGIKLLTPFVALDECEQDSFGLTALLSLLLESIIGFCKLLMTCTTTNLACVSICVDCGIFVASLSCSTKHALLRVFASHAKSLCIKASCLRASNDADVRLATPLSKESALALSIVNGVSQRNFQLFETVALIFIWDETGAGFDFGMVTDFLGEPISGDLNAQRSRVTYLAALQTGIAMPVLSDEIDEKKVLQHSCYTWIVDSKGHTHRDPLIRLLWWQSLAWLLLCADKVDIRGICQDVSVSESLLSDLLTVSFADPVSAIRDYASRELGTVVLATNGVLAIFLTRENAQNDIRSNEPSPKTSSQSSRTRIPRVDAEKGGSRVSSATALYGPVLSLLFQTIDRLLYEYSSVPQALLSFTVGVSSGKGKCGSVSNSLVLAHQRSALRALASMMKLKYVSNDVVNETFKNAFLRALTISGGDGSPEPIETRGLCHGELALVRFQIDFFAPLQSCLDEISPDIFYNLLVPCSGFEVEPSRRSIAIESIPTTRREQRHRLLCSTIQRFISEKRPGDIVFVSSGVSEVLRVTDAYLPGVLSQFVLEKEYDTLRLGAEFKIFIMHLDRENLKICERSSHSNFRSNGDSASPDRTIGGVHTRRRMKKVWAANLEDETRRLCLSPHFIERILATVFIKGEQSDLIFLMKIVLQNALTLPKIMESDQLILKELLWQLGRQDLSSRAVKALRYAAHARNEDVLDITTQGSDCWANRSSSGDEELILSWMSRHFMFLLVNVVQYRWNGKTLAEKAQSLRCLSILLQHLRHSEACKYVPQIMSTVNAAITAGNGGEAQAELSLRAVEVLSEFVKLLAQHHCEIIGANLVAIVVCVVPLLTPSDDGNDKSESTRLVHTAREAAVALLEWLTQGELGRKLAPHFNEIPFLPTSGYMATVRSNLKLVGSDFDRLSLTLENAHNISHRQSMTSDGSTDAQRSEMARKQEVLRHRLRVMLPLIFDENASIRRVTLQHVVELLRANRELFHFLIDNEGAASMGRYLTLAYDGRGQSHGVVSDLVEALLTRCINETDTDARLLLAACFGEVGAFDSKRLESIRTRNVDVQTKPFHGTLGPPWRVEAAEYEIRLLNKELVLGLKAAETSSDQNKIAYTIQQLLALLDKHCETGAVPSSQQCLAADVIDVIEPFRHTEFREGADTVVTKRPPFFETSRTYKGWLADWCRHMILSSKQGKETAWVELFWACRLAVRSHAGLPVAEALFPILVLDRLCFGKSKDEREIVNELIAVLSFEQPSHMDPSDRRKAVDAVFNLLDTIELWVEDEVERKHRLRHNDKKKESEDDVTGLEWPRDSSMIRTEDLLKAIPLSLRARAASKVGMHAMALRLLEIATRKTCASIIFNSSQANGDTVINKRSRAAGNCPEKDLNTMKDALAALNDYETMISLTDEHFRFDPDLRLRDSIRQKEAAGDWEGALQDYEQAQHLCGPDHGLQLGSLKCLLELGHFDSVLNQVNGMVFESKDHTELSLSVDINATLPFAIEAAWRLGRWETLDCLIEQGSKTAFKNPKALYQASVGKVMLGIKRKNSQSIRQDIRAARGALMDSLSGFARESYSRAYSHLVQLQCLREIEESAELLSAGDAVYPEPHAFERNWNRRLDMLSSNGASTVIKTRLALARLAGDASMEGSLYLNLGRRARKNSLRGIAAHSFALAEATLASISGEKNTALERCSLQVQMAKLKHDYGESGRALQLLQLDDEEKLAGESIHALQLTAYKYARSLLPKSEEDGLSESQAIAIYCRSLLQSTRWMIEDGLKDATQIKDRFMILHSLQPKWEKGHFYYAKYIDSLLKSRIEAIQRRSPERFLGLDEERARHRCIMEDRACHRNILTAVQHYTETLKLDTKHVYHALPRLLSLWFDFTSLELVDTSPITSVDSAARRVEPQSTTALSMAQEEVNAFIAREYKLIPPRAFYTAISQLVSCITHSSKDTEKLVRVILTRVLFKHPEQTMWLLGWLRQSQFRDRRQIGEEVFKRAEQNLLRLGCDSTHRYNVLVESKSLFKYFHDLATHKISDMSVQKLAVKPWKGTVSLMDFVPPVQAALSVSFLSSTDQFFHDSFPRQVPRMRSFQKEVGVMGSKARPKKLKVFVVSADTYRSTDSDTLPDRPRRDAVDIGEIHFLIKQEAKGDLRKDARVQDLSTVVNRLMTSSTSGNRESQSGRALRLRTYAVTCLSEDTGILEWVPDTESLRSLIAKSYNPQASPFSVKRRGARVANFGDPMLRTNFERKCQPLFFENGNLRRAATLFEELCLKPYPPLLYWWFIQHFSDPHAWYEARTRFILSAAIWSGIGHVIGLGDRHSENILVDTSLGECVHVDFDCIFDKGLTLPKPETVPFRLTHNMIDAFGPTGVDGVFTQSLKSTMRVLRDNHEMLLSVLEPFIKDPIIDWRRLRSPQKNQEQGTVTSERQTLEAKRSLLVIDQRLKGIYNLRNPNLKKVRRSDLRGALQQDDDLMHLVPLSVDGQVHKMISEATSNENLVQLYVGWMPWL